ncbi:MAG TPA: adenylate kinase [Planctomycetota bacterium]|nr:adenylate kinase [Planctomycetota bacterium]
MKSDLQRVVVVGTSCSGKSLLARQIAEALGIPHVEMDALFWLPNWRKRPKDEFREILRDAVAGEAWVMDGNYGWSRDIVLPRVTHVVWLNYPFWTVLRRALVRTIRRAVTREKVCGENRESFRNSFLHHQGIPWYVIRTHRGVRKHYRALAAGDEHPHLEVIELRNQHDADTLVSQLRENA